MKKTNLLILLVVLAFGCNEKIAPKVTKVMPSPPPYKLSAYSQNLNSMITLEPSSTMVHLGDFDAPENYHRIFTKGVYVIRRSQSELEIRSSDKTPVLTVLNYTVKGDSTEYVIPIRKSPKKSVHFSFSPQGKSYKTAQLVGDINAWNPANTPMKLEKGQWVADLDLVPGRYAYQVVLDGKWQLDTNNQDSIENGMGGWNSLLVVDGPKKESLPVLITKDFTDTKIVLDASQADHVLALWQNQRIFAVKQDNGTYILPLPKIESSKHRSFIRAWAYNKHGISNDILIPLENGKVVSDAKQLTRFDKATNDIYFVFVDRFFNGRKNNDEPLNDPEVHPRADVHGGDLAGVIQKLKSGYFNDLGFTAIWLSPIVQNPKGAFGFYNKKGIKSKFSAFHGYWPISFSEIDERFGTKAELKELVRVAHERGINIYLDFVANHVHELHPVYQANKDKGWATNLYLPDGTLNTEKWDEHRLTTWFDVFLPTLNLEKQEVTEMLSDSALFWLETYDIDGFRHDATKHIPKNFWRTLTKKVRKYEQKRGEPVFQIGETYGTPELINSYLGTGMLDGQFDFNVYDALLSSICRDDVGFEVVAQRLSQSFDYYGQHNLMGYMTGNQDKPRFMAMATGDVKFDEDAKYAGWSRKIQKKTDKGYKKLAMMHAILQTIPGIPVSYYGDEIGLTGGNDPDNRRDMRFVGLTQNEVRLRKKVAELTHLRRSHLAFLYGDFHFLRNEGNIMVYSRQFFHSFGVVVVNNSDNDQVIEFDLPKGVDSSKLTTLNKSKFTITSTKGMLSLPPNSFEIFYTVQ